MKALRRREIRKEKPQPSTEVKSVRERDTAPETKVTEQELEDIRWGSDGPFNG